MTGTAMNYFFCGDILGFKNIIKNLKESELHQRIEKWTILVAECAQESGIEKFQLISDTVFATTQANEAGLNSIIKFSRNLLEKGIENSFPIRGAITKGDVVWGKMIYGKAVIKSHQIEIEQNWIGVTCESLLSEILPWGENGLICYPPPKKSGAIQLHPVVVWKIPTSEILIPLLCKNGLTKDGELIMWDGLGIKINNTIEFSNYLRIINSKKGDFSNFQGYFPSQHFEEI